MITKGQPIIVHQTDEQGLPVAYAVFRDVGELMDFDKQFNHYFLDCCVVCWNNLDNAFFLGRVH